MRHVVLILAILGSLLPGGAGIFLLMQHQEDKATIESNKKELDKVMKDYDTAVKFGLITKGEQIRIKGKIQEYNMQLELYHKKARVYPFLLGTVALALLAGVIVEMRRGLSAALLLLTAAAGPAILHPIALCASSPLLLPALLALFVRPSRPSDAGPPAKPSPADRRRRREEDEDDRREEPSEDRDEPERETRSADRRRRREEDEDEAPAELPEHENESRPADRRRRPRPDDEE
jgi:hypothetical protein